MKGYLIAFFEEFAYPAPSREVLLAAYEQIVTAPETASRFAALLEAYDRDMNLDYAALIAEMTALCEGVDLHPYTGHTVLFVCLSRRLHERYREQGISDDIWHDSMLDLRYKLIECHLVHGVWGTFVAKWNDGFFNMTRFALGRLQFEIRPFGFTYEKNGVTLTPGSPVLNTHIPRSEQPLTRESVWASYALAADFFKDRLQGAPVAFYCSSWLLFDKHREMLKPTSNIYRFISDFDVVETGTYKDYAEVWRLFDRHYKGDPDELPADSSLRRAYVDLMKKGEPTGWGKGILLYNK
jgi:hypothetical protein